MGYIRLWKVGSKDKPATADDIKDVENLIAKLNENDRDLVTHHLVTCEVIHYSDPVELTAVKDCVRRCCKDDK